MPGTKREHSVHVRLADKEHAVLELIATAAGRDMAAVAADLLARSLLGEGHALMVAAERFVRSGLSGTSRDEHGGSGR